MWTDVRLSRGDYWRGREQLVTDCTHFRRVLLTWRGPPAFAFSWCHFWCVCWPFSGSPRAWIHWASKQFLLWKIKKQNRSVLQELINLINRVSTQVICYNCYFKIWVFLSIHLNRPPFAGYGGRFKRIENNSRIFWLRSSSATHGLHFVSSGLHCI